MEPTSTSFGARWRGALWLSALSVLSFGVLGGCTAPKKGAATQPVAGLFDAVRDHGGAPVPQGAVLGHWSVLWFYPKAQTSG